MMKLILVAAALISLLLPSREPNLYEKSRAALIERVGSALESPVSLPAPCDGGGGPVHETHKANYMLISDLAKAWQLTGDRRYSDRLRAMLIAYADMYPGLGYHPIDLSHTPGRLFWQTLNECVWLVHVAPAYQSIRSTLSEADRNHIDNDLIRPMAEFAMQGTPDNRANLATFNSIHNHGTWAVAAVGLAGFALGDDSLVEKALYGTDLSGSNGGFLQQMDELFSPDGYYTEGAYYQRYAIWPFFLFASALDKERPQLKIFERRDGILLKSVDALIQMSYKGMLLPFNDAVAKDLTAQELICAIDIAYSANPSRKDLLSIVRDYHDRVLLTEQGLKVAKDLAAGKARPYEFRSVLLSDGADGSQGGYAILRSPGGAALGFKATSQGMGHGHFDRLSLIYCDNGNEILSDYGSARFVNVDEKYHGHYTPENKSYAKQTIAHNTLVVDGVSHYKASAGKAGATHAEILAFNTADPSFQYVGGCETSAYKDVTLTRWTALAETDFLQYPILLDLMIADSRKPHVYDLPFHYNGHMISLTVPYNRALDRMEPAGENFGYQHLWLEASASAAPGSTSFTWMTGDRMYSLSSATDPGTEILMLRTGANDPSFHLRSEPVLVLRRKSQGRAVFASCIETHGIYDNSTEQSANLVHSCSGVKVLSDDDSLLKVEYIFAGGQSLRLVLDKKASTLSIDR